MRVWEVVYYGLQKGAEEGCEDPLEIRRVRKIKTNVADVSSMTMLQDTRGDGLVGDGATRVLICGVGMEVIRLEWEG